MAGFAPAACALPMRCTSRCASTAKMEGCGIAIPVRPDPHGNWHPILAPRGRIERPQSPFGGAMPEFHRPGYTAFQAAPFAGVIAILWPQMAPVSGVEPLRSRFVV